MDHAEPTDPNAPLLRLRDLVLENLTDEDRAYWNARLQEDGYKGTFEERLLELCLRSDLVSLLREMFTQAQLHRLVDGLVTEGAHRAFADDAKEMVHRLGFTVVRPRQSIWEIVALIKRQQGRMETVESRADLRGCIMEAASLVEVAVRDVVHFYGTVLLPRPLGEFFQTQRWVSPDRPFDFDRMTLGDLFFLLESFDRHLKDGRRGGEAAERFHELFPGRRGLLGRGSGSLQGVARIRNRFGHYQEEIDACSLPGLRLFARELFNAVVPFVQYLGESGIFPRTVTVREFVQDGYGRRFVRAVDDQGKEEVIVTDESLDPALPYFMHPLTNPIRLYPRLVART